MLTSNSIGYLQQSHSNLAAIISCPDSSTASVNCSLRYDDCDPNMSNMPARLPVKSFPSSIWRTLFHLCPMYETTRKLPRNAWNDSFGINGYEPQTCPLDTNLFSPTVGIRHLIFTKIDWKVYSQLWCCEQSPALWPGKEDQPPRLLEIIFTAYFTLLKGLIFGHVYLPTLGAEPSEIDTLSKNMWALNYSISYSALHASVQIRKVTKPICNHMAHLKQL